MTKLHAGDKAPDFRLSNQDEKDVNLAEYKGRMNEMKEGQAEKRNAVTESSSRPSFAFSEDSFSRLDESDDSIFYSRDRFVQHLDSLALSTVEKIIQELVIEKTPANLGLDGQLGLPHSTHHSGGDSCGTWSQPQRARAQRSPH